MATTCIINCSGLFYSENPMDFPNVRFPFAKLVMRDSQQLLKQADICSTFWNRAKRLKKVWQTFVANEPACRAGNNKIKLEKIITEGKPYTKRSQCTNSPNFE